MSAAALPTAGDYERLADVADRACTVAASEVVARQSQLSLMQTEQKRADAFRRWLRWYVLVALLLLVSYVASAYAHMRVEFKNLYDLFHGQGAQVEGCRANLFADSVDRSYQSWFDIALAMQYPSLAALVVKSPLSQAQATFVVWLVDSGRVWSVRQLCGCTSAESYSPDAPGGLRPDPQCAGQSAPTPVAWNAAAPAPAPAAPPPDDGACGTGMAAGTRPPHCASGADAMCTPTSEPGTVYVLQAAAVADMVSNCVVANKGPMPWKWATLSPSKSDAAYYCLSMPSPTDTATYEHYSVKAPGFNPLGDYSGDDPARKGTYLIRDVTVLKDPGEVVDLFNKGIIGWMRSHGADTQTVSELYDALLGETAPPPVCNASPSTAEGATAFFSGATSYGFLGQMGFGGLAGAAQSLSRFSWAERAIPYAGPASAVLTLGASIAGGVGIPGLGGGGVSGLKKAKRDRCAQFGAEE